MKKIYIATWALLTLMFSALSICAQTQSREDLIREISAKRAELSRLEEAFLSPTADDRASYADFLGQPNTGLIRLLPREKYDADVKKENSNKLTLRGGGAYYSFVRLTHEYGYGSDIGLYDGWLYTGFAGANYGIITTLGNTPLENITVETPAVQFLATHAPPSEEPKARIEQTKWGKGEMIDGTTYSERLRMGENTTYLIRSVDYDTSDVLVAFRVVRIDNDGSAIILWKLLKTYPVPKLARK
ncbi:MAG TPA: hypothetical protein VFR12_11430 [Pyrinomonadaceae bacterium]|nr:hypothetical protein [Pyrinomonadaceae bacterium]